ncbi:hypothetical protein [Nitrosospira multiformis]|uniref:Uncharacterized protein n=1 Tax=Nitrosospira multiformis TaxID=1231 RepID=A0A1I7ITR2_9PROT|nr:hypothetical protein [Nitrosospira multiformis]SFU76326.1 hypothetical protein SAMN05216417_12633 [Nitrosospira multiformis]
MTYGTSPAIQANDFLLEGQNKQIHFAATTFPGVPFLSYKDEEDESNNREFRGDEIDIQETKFGKLITVLIGQVPDSHMVYLALLLPTIYLPGQTGFPPISRTHLKRLIMSQEVCHGKAKEICSGVQAGSGTVGSIFKCSGKPGCA